MKKSSAAKVGILTLVSLILLILCLMWIKGRSISAGSRTTVIFHDVDGIRTGSAVQMMGIRVGQIEEISPVFTKEDNYVKLKFVITEPNIVIPKASELSIQQSGIIGEKFLEITPPKQQFLYLPISKKTKNAIFEGCDVELLVDGTYKKIGNIKSTDIVNTSELSPIEKQNIFTKLAYKIGYIVTEPGIVVPDDVKYEILRENQLSYLKLTPPQGINIKSPKYVSDYTVVEPFRLKDFLNAQLKTAISLNETNEKLNTILSDQVILDVQDTIKNVKVLTAKANTTLDSATILMNTSKTEMTQITSLTTELVGKVGKLSDNVNDIVGDPEFKTNVNQATKSVNTISNNLNKVIDNGDVEQTLKYLNQTVKNLSEVSQFINETSKDPQVKSKLNTTINNLNDSMSKFSQLAGNVNQLTTDQKAEVKQVVNDATEISANLKKFSEKLNKRFLIIRLMF